MIEILATLLKILCFMTGMAVGISIGYALIHHPVERSTHRQLTWRRHYERFAPTRSIMATPKDQPHFSAHVWMAAIRQVVRLRRSASRVEVPGVE